MLVRNLNDQITIWTKGMEDLYGFTRDEALGKVSHELLRTRPPLPVFDNIKNSIAQSGYWKGELEHKTKNGQMISVSSLQAFYRDANGDPIAIIEVNQDITKRKRVEETLQESEEKYRELIENANSIIIRMDREGKISFFNDYAQKFFGYSLGEVIGQNIKMLVPSTESGSGRSLEEMADNILMNPDDFTENINENVRKNGERVWVSWWNKAIRDASGDIIGNLAVGQDISERKRTEEELRKEKDFTTAILNTAGALMVVLDKQGRITGFNRECERITGYEFKEVLGRVFWDFLVPKEDLEGVRQAWEALHAGNFPNKHENRWVAKDGSQYLVSWSNTAILGFDGQIEHIVAVGIDITERKQAEESLIKSQNQMQGIIDNTPALVYMLDLNGRFLLVNKSLADLLNSSPEKMIGKRRHEFMPKDDADRHEENDRKAIKAGKAIEFEEYSQLDGRSITWLTTKFPLRDTNGEIYALAGITSDISDRKQAEEALRQSERLYRSIGESIDYGVWVCAPDGRNIYASESFLKMVGITQEQCSNFGWGDVLHPDDSAGTIAAWQDCVRTGKPWNREHRFRGIDGQWHHVLARGVPVRDERGQITSWAGINLDISDLKKAQENLRQSEEQFRTLADSIPTLAWWANPDGYITWYNSRWYEYTGTTPEQMEGWGWQSVHDPRVLPKVLERWKGSIDTGLPFEMEFPLRGADGQFRVFLTRVEPLKDAQGRVAKWFGTSADVEELRHAKEELEDRVKERTAQLRTAFAELTQAEERERKRLAVILHDHLQQVLAASKMRINLLKKASTESELHSGIAESINLIQESINISRSLTIELCPPILIDEKLPASLEWLGGWMKKQHGLDVAVWADQKADPGEHDIRVFLFNSARELLFNVQKHAGVNWAEIRTKLIDSAVIEMQVIDEGAGMDTTRLTKVFNLADHFGLFSIRERLEFLGGTVRVESKPNEGTRVIIRVPMQQQ